MTDRTLAAGQMHQARTTLLLSKPLFSACMRLGMEESTKVGTCATDGRKIVYNPEWISSLTAEQRIAVWAHETAHCMALHVWRCGARDLKRWNVACDYVINRALAAEGFTLTDMALLDPQYNGKSAEHIYPLIPEQDPNGPAGMGDMLEPSDEEGNGEPAPGELSTEEQWAAEASNAELVAEQMKAGTRAGELARLMAEARKTRTPWRDILAEFVQHCVPAGTSWSHPDRRYIWQGIHLPGTVRENIAPLVVFVDTSGSVDQDMLKAFGREITTLMEEARPARIDVVYVDTEVRGWESFEPDNGPVILNAKGGGGTLFQPAFNWLKDQPETFAGCIYLTDLDSADVPTDPGIPTLWVVTESTHRTGPFGRTIRFQQEY